MDYVAYMLASAAVGLATKGLARAHEAADGEGKDLYLSLGVALDECLATRPPTETMFLCTALSVLLDGKAAEGMGLLRDGFSESPRRVGGVPVQVNDN